MSPWTLSPLRTISDYDLRPTGSGPSSARPAFLSGDDCDASTRLRGLGRSRPHPERPDVSSQKRTFSDSRHSPPRGSLAVSRMRVRNQRRATSAVLGCETVGCQPDVVANHGSAWPRSLRLAQRDLGSVIGMMAGPGRSPDAPDPGHRLLKRVLGVRLRSAGTRWCWAALPRQLELVLEDEGSPSHALKPCGGTPSPSHRESYPTQNSLPSGSCMTTK
jgi:hypothetical protein